MRRDMQRLFIFNTEEGLTERRIADTFPSSFLNNFIHRIRGSIKTLKKKNKQYETS